MEPHHYSTHGYGHGYWSQYGVSSHSEDASDFEATTYKVFPQQHIEESTSLDDEPRFTTRANEEKKQVNNLLEFLELLYSESHDLYNRVCAKMDENYLLKHKGKEEKGRGRGFSKLFKRVPSKLYKKKLDSMKVRMMIRSLSLGSPRSPTAAAPWEDYSERKLERFKVNTVDLKGVQGKNGGQGAAK